MGVSLREIIENTPAACSTGPPIKAIIPGGVSMPVLTRRQIDVSMDHDSLDKAGTLLGTGGIVVMDDRTCMVRAAIVIARFFRHESCGQCTQCREGTGWITKILQRLEAGEGSVEDLKTIGDCCFFMDGKCICALADGAAWSARAFLTQFRAEFERHVTERKCPFGETFSV